MPLTIGVDVGGTKIAAGVVDDDGHILAQLRRETPSSDSVATVDAVAGLAAELALAHEVEGIGIGAPGFIDETRSIVRFAPNLAWREEPLGEAVHKRTNLPVVVENDANSAAWAEARFGAARDHSDVVMLTIGTGVGGGIVIGNRLVPRSFRHRRRDRAYERRSGRATVRLRESRLLRAVRERPGARTRGP